MGILTVLIAILVIMLLARRRINIGLAMYAGCVVLALGIPLSMEQIAQGLKAAYLSPVTWELVAAVLLIGVLGHILKATGALSIMVDRLLKLMGDPRWIMIVLPGLIGALSVPGGAMMSAPLVDQLGDRVKIGPEYKTGINIIFRHIWYLALPIIPSMILAASLVDLRPQQLAILNLPALALGLVGAWFFLLHPLQGRVRGKWNNRDFREFFLSLLPLLLVIVLYLVLGVNFVLALAVGIVAALINLPDPGAKPLLFRMLNTGWARVRTVVLPGLRPSLILVVAGIMLFKELLTVCGVVNTFASDLVGLGIPLWLLLLFLPMLVGLATGSHEAAVGIAIPVFVPLLSPDIYLAGVGLTYLTATLGYLSSPLHLCIILTREFFNANFVKIYRYIGPVVLVMLVSGLLTALIRGL